MMYREVLPRLPYAPTCLTVGWMEDEQGTGDAAGGEVEPCRSLTLLVGATNGKVYVYRCRVEEGEEGRGGLVVEEEASSVLDAKGGGILRLALRDVTGFGRGDVVAGDAHGNTSIFSGGKLLSHNISTRDNAVQRVRAGGLSSNTPNGNNNNNRNISSASRGCGSVIGVDVLVYDQNPEASIGDPSSTALGDKQIISVLSDGKIFAQVVPAEGFSNSYAWKYRLVDMMTDANMRRLDLGASRPLPPSASSPSAHFRSAASCGATSLCCGAVLIGSQGDGDGGSSNSYRSVYNCFAVVADIGECVHYFNNGRVAASVQMPAMATSLCIANMNLNNVEGQRVVAACVDKAVYAIDCDFGVYRLFESEHDIEQVRSVDLFFKNGQKSTLIVCSGHFCSLQVFFNGILVMELKTKDWVFSFEVKQIGNSLMFFTGVVESEIVLFDIPVGKIQEILDSKVSKANK
eukprot:Nk52_evm23s228 gene=Nk52_evmTU23s228